MTALLLLVRRRQQWRKAATASQQPHAQHGGELHKAPAVRPGLLRHRQQCWTFGLVSITGNFGVAGSWRIVGFMLMVVLMGFPAGSISLAGACG